MDLSGPSFAACARAKELARRVGATVEALYVHAPPEMDLAPYYWDSALSAREKGRITRALRARLGPGPEILLLEGIPEPTILKTASARQADLIVMGTHGRSGLPRLLLGSVTEAVVRRSPVPVLTVRGGRRPIRSILAPVNFTTYSDIGFIYAAGVAAVLGAKLTALHIEPDKKKAGNWRFSLAGMLQRLPNWVREKCRPAALVKTGEPAAAITRAAKNHDLVVLVAHRKNPLKDVFFGTTFERVLRSSSAPVLAVPSPDSQLLSSLRLWERLQSA